MAELTTRLTQSGPRLIVAWAEYALTIAARTLRAETRGAFLEMINEVLRNYSDLMTEPWPTPWTGPHWRTVRGVNRMADYDHIAQLMKSCLAWVPFPRSQCTCRLEFPLAHTALEFPGPASLPATVLYCQSA